MNVVDPRVLAKMVTEEYKYEWGTSEATAYMKALTLASFENNKENKTNNKYHYKAVTEEQEDMEILEMDVDSIFTPEEVADMEIEIDTMQFSDLENLGVFDQEELDDFAMSDELDIHDNIDILETLTIQGNRKDDSLRGEIVKNKVARMRVAREYSSDPSRIKRRATRGARNMIKSRLARGRDMSSLLPAEKSRLEMMKKVLGLVARLATRMLPVVRNIELKKTY